MTQVDHFTVYKDQAGEWRWRYQTANNRITADSGEGYENIEDAFDAIASFKEGAAAAPVEVKDDDAAGSPQAD